MRCTLRVIPSKHTCKRKYTHSLCSLATMAKQRDKSGALRGPAVHAFSLYTPCVYLWGFKFKIGSLYVLTEICFRFLWAKGIRQCQRVTKSHTQGGVPDYEYCSSAGRFFPPLDSSETRERAKLGWAGGAFSSTIKCTFRCCDGRVRRFVGSCQSTPSLH